MNSPATISNFPQLDHDDVTGEMADLYRDVRDILRVPLGRVRDPRHVTVPPSSCQKRPLMATRYAEAGADLVREASIIPGDPPPDPRPKLQDKEWRDQDIVDLRHALDALNDGKSQVT